MNKKLLVAVIIAAAFVTLAAPTALLISFVLKDNKAFKSDFIENASCGLDMKMVYVEGGKLWQSKGEGVALDGFWIGECEVTQAQWSAIMGTSIYHQSEMSRMQTGEARPMRGVGPDYPMYYVNYYEAKEFCRKLSELTGRKYDLPTEAQWEYAARGGKDYNLTNYAYSGSNYVGEVAWYDNNSGTSSHQVKTKKANELGIYDMSGNLREWCKDWYSYKVYLDLDNPQGPSYGTERVVRGGCWRYGSHDCYVWCREFARREVEQNPNYSTSYIGFRVVCLD